MSMQQTVVIIGGGVAGLACAQTLHAARIPFTLVTEDIGGRITENSTHAINYGAYYITADYKHVQRLVKRRRRITIFNFAFHHPGQTYQLASLRGLRYLPQLLRFRHQLQVFRRHLRRFRQAALTEEQSALLQQDPYFWPLIQQSASDFIQQHKLTELFTDFIAEALYATDFVSIHRIQAFDLLWLVQPLITRTYEYSFNPTQVVRPFKHQILRDTVTAITPQSSGYRLMTMRHHTIEASYVVLAVPTPGMQQLLHTTDGKQPVNAYMYHLRGTPRPDYTHARYHVFEDAGRLCTIAKQTDGSYLVYASQPIDDLAELFTDDQLITSRVWKPAFNVIGKSLTKQKRDNGLYVAGEHNICTLEDSYITGVYAANQIIQQLHSHR